MNKQQATEKIKAILKEKGEVPDRKYKMWDTFWTGLITGDKKVEVENQEYFGDI